MNLLKGIFLQILNMGITASYVILAVLIIRACIRKAPKIFSYLLWLTVGYRLISPVSFTSMISVFNLKFFTFNHTEDNIGTINYLPFNVASMGISKGSVDIPITDQMINSNLLEVTTATSANPIQTLINMAMFLWVFVAIGLLVYSVVSYIKLKQRVEKAVRWKDNIYECNSISSPFVLGFINPRIYIPFHLTEQEQIYILMHERYHIKRFDYVVKPLSFLLLIVYWFNPLVWLAYFSMSMDMEMSCDEKVLDELGGSIKNDYSMSLLSFAANRRFPIASPLAFGEMNIKGRIKNVLNFKKPNSWISIAIALLCITAIVAFIANPLKNSGEETIGIEAAGTKVTGTEAAEIKETKETKETTAIDTVIAEISDYAQSLYDNRNPYIGDAPADGELLAELGIPDYLGTYTIELEYLDRNILRIVFEKEVAEGVPFEGQFFQYSGILLALIDNADEIQWSFPTVYNGKETQLITFINDQNYKQIDFDNIKSYGESAARVQQLLDLLEEHFPQDNTFNITPTVIPIIRDESEDKNTDI